MTMPITFDTAKFALILIDAGLSPEQARAHAESVRFALGQPVANDSDLVVLHSQIHAMFAEHETKMKAWVEARLAARLQPVYWGVGLILVLQIMTMTKLFL